MGCLNSCLKCPAEEEKGEEGQNEPEPPMSTGESARQFNPKREFELEPVDLDAIQILVLDKTFQDHGKLYNDLLENFNSLKQAIQKFNGMFAMDATITPSLLQCIRIMKERCGDAELGVTKSKYGFTIKYDAQVVSRMCTVPAEDAIRTLDLYNEANRLTESILDTSPQAEQGMQAVLGDEKGLIQEISKSNLTESEKPEAMKICIRNINKLKKSLSAINTIREYSKNISKQILEASV